MYLKAVPLFGKSLHHFIVLNKSRPPHAGGAALSRWSSPGLAPFLGGSGQCGYSCTIPAGGHLAQTDLRCTRPAYTVEAGFEPGTLRLRN
ncbi:hypothetical protein AVEN_267458-1 [Araneus ventricosus]|uniref:Uncharacterized protein n=1 Tax=Araneus ventricosus TaxID=182803 RepID=A0A4Y2F2C7_ARAVE|nr:hypothetical protein AVEN_267458-1 [Araneus ventricosus]